MNYKKPAFWIVLAAVLAGVALIVCFAAKPKEEPDQQPEATSVFAALTDGTGSAPAFSDGLASRGMVYGGHLVYISGDDVRAIPLNGEGESAILIPRQTLQKQLPKHAKDLYWMNFKSFFLDGNRLVMDIISLDDPVSRFVAYDLTDGSAQLLCTTAKTYEWTILDGKLYYLEPVSDLVGNADVQILRVLDLQSGEDREICPQVTAFGAAGGVIRYVSFAEDSYRVYQYDPAGASALLGAIPASLGTNCVFAFTEDYIAMGRFGNEVWNYDYDAENAKKLIVYAVVDGTTAEYSLGSELQELVVCGRYAFIQAYNMRQDSRNPDKTAGLYRLDLSNGETLWVQRPFLGGLYTGTEETALFWKYSASDEAFGTLYRYDVSSGEETMIGDLK